MNENQLFLSFNEAPEETHGQYKRKIRSITLDPEFKNGYSKNWHFCLPEAYKNELDIKYTERKVDKKTVYQWTQGPFFCFSEGHIIYDTAKAYFPWNEALQHIVRFCEVIHGTPNMIDDQKTFIHGQVFFAIYKPNNEKNGVIKEGSYKMTQNNFVEFLKTGNIDEKKLLQT